MSFLPLFLQAAGAAGAAGASPAGAGIVTFLPFILIILIMYFLMIRPQNKKQKETQKMLDALKKGDKVITAGGIYGTVADVDDRTVLIKVDGETKLRVDKSSIQKDMSEAPAQTDKK